MILKKGLFVVVLLLSLALLLSGCVLTVEQMYRLPKRSDAYNNLQSSIDQAMAGMVYCAPLSGENQQSVQMADLDGDGVQEYLLFAKCTQEKPLRIFVFHKVEDAFVNTDTVACNGSAFDQVEYVDMDGDGGMEIVVGRQLSDQVIRSVSVYTFSGEELVQLVSANYTKFLTTDLDENGMFELFLLRPGIVETDAGVAELYSMRNGTMERYNESSMSRPVDNLKRIIIGKLYGGKTAVFAASAAGDNALVTDIYVLEGGALTNVAFSNETGTSVKTLRNFYIYADDIDKDAVVELPNLISMKPTNDMTLTDTQQLIRWYAMSPDGTQIDKMYTYHNFVGGWYLQLHDEWAPRLVVKNLGQQYDFYLWDESYDTTCKVLSIYVLTGQNREEQALYDGKFILLKTESTVYAATLDEGASDYGLTQDFITFSFRLIQKDWKTGET